MQADTAIAEPSHTPGLHELGSLASWSVTSAKAGNGLEQLRDGRNDTFWQ